MDRVKIKETAKNLLKKNHWLCVGITFIVALLGGSTAKAPTLNLNFLNEETTSTTIPEEFEFWQDSLQDENVVGFILLFLLFFTVCMAAGFAINAFVGSQVKVGSCRFFLKYRKNQPVEVGELFKSYSDKTFINVAKVSLVKNISIFLWSMLCIVPGIIKTYEYAAVDYILSVNPTMDYRRALDLSKRIMQGHKLELFELYISFLGWHLLSMFTCGLLNILYVVPYQMIAEAEFFSYVRELAILNGTISYSDFPDYEYFTPPTPAYQGYAPNSFYQPPVNMNYNGTPVQPIYAPQPVVAPIQPVYAPQPVVAPVQPVYAPQPIAESVQPTNDSQITSTNTETPPPQASETASASAETVVEAEAIADSQVDIAADSSAPEISE